MVSQVTAKKVFPVQHVRWEGRHAKGGDYFTDFNKEHSFPD